jgi:hypothetical protein
MTSHHFKPLLRPICPVWRAKTDGRLRPPASSAPLIHRGESAYPRATGRRAAGGHATGRPDVTDSLWADRGRQVPMARMVLIGQEAVHIRQSRAGSQRGSQVLGWQVRGQPSRTAQKCSHQRGLAGFSPGYEACRGFQPHYLRRLSLQIGAAYVFLVLGGFGLRSSESRSAPPVHIPAVLFPTTSPAQTVGASPSTTTRVSVAPSVTLPATAPSATVSPAAASSDTNATQPTVSVSYLVADDYATACRARAR